MPTAVDWPVQAAERALLQWDATTSTTTSKSKKQGAITAVKHCKLVYDATQRYLRVVDCTNKNADSNDSNDDSNNNNDETVLDTIDMDDMIGADIEIALVSKGGGTSSNATGVRAASAESPTTASNEPSSEQRLADTQAVAKLTLYVYPRRDPTTVSLWHQCGLISYQPRPTPQYERPMHFASHGTRFAHHRRLTFLPSEDLHDARTLVAALKQLATPQTPSKKTKTKAPPHYLILVNPKAGPQKNAQKIAETQVVPVLEQAGIATTLWIAQHAGHAVGRCQQQPPNGDGGDQDVSWYDALVVVGGDGTLHEVINGIRSRSDAGPNGSILANLPIGIVGCGTSNGLASSLAHAAGEKYSVLTDVWAIAKGQTVTADLSTYSVLPSSSSSTTTTSAAPPTTTAAAEIKTYTSFLTYTWGMIADVDIESEKIHWMGESRFDVWAVLRILMLRQYPARFSYTTTTISVTEPDATTTIPAVTDPVPSTWTTIEDNMVIFWASQVTHVRGCRTVPEHSSYCIRDCVVYGRHGTAFFTASPHTPFCARSFVLFTRSLSLQASMSNYHSPSTRFQDGVFTIMLVRGNVSRLRLARILLGLGTGTHAEMPGVEWVRCTAFRLEPKNTAQSFNDIDGEPIEQGPIQGKHFTYARTLCMECDARITSHQPMLTS